MSIYRARLRNTSNAQLLLSGITAPY